MGFFDFFRKKQKITPSELNIDITNKTAVINDNVISLPCHIDAFASILGKPRYFAGQAGNINFIWDDLGVYCYINNRSLIYAIGIKTHKSDIAAGFDPGCMFAGKLTIYNKPWEEIMYGGNDIEIAREREYGDLSLFSEYADFEKGDSEGCTDAYTGVEIKLNFS